MASDEQFAQSTFHRKRSLLGVDRLAVVYGRYSRRLQQDIPSPIVRFREDYSSLVG